MWPVEVAAKKARASGRPLSNIDRWHCACADVLARVDAECGTDRTTREWYDGLRRHSFSEADFDRAMRGEPWLPPMQDMAPNHRQYGQSAT